MSVRVVGIVIQLRIYFITQLETYHILNVMMNIIPLILLQRET